MKSRWKKEEADACQDDLLALRVYSSRLLGADEDLVLHGGGNTSVKITEENLFGESEELLYVKGSGWDLATIEKEGFAPVRMYTLLQMADLAKLSDADMVKHQRAAMTNPYAPNPSVEAILHAIIPFTFVDHTHTDAVVTLTNTPKGESYIQEVYGDDVLVIPYIMPGFILARDIFQLTQNINWEDYKGMVLMNHGLFTWDDDPKKSYEKHIRLVSKAEKFLKEKKAVQTKHKSSGKIDTLKLARLRQMVSQELGSPAIIKTDNSREAVGFSKLPKISDLISRGPVTPDHIIRTKRTGLFLGKTPEEAVETFKSDYIRYFKEHKTRGLQMLDTAPRWGVWPGVGTLAFGKTLKEVNIIHDIKRHTTKVIQQAEILGGWKALPEKDLFEMEYWELEQAKLKKAGTPPEFQGKIALVTGAASGIGKACVESLVAKGAVVAALDINPMIESLFGSNVKGIICDLTDDKAIQKAVEATIATFGGLDIVVSNAGLFPKSAKLKEMPSELWDKSVELNLTSHQRLLTYSLPYLALGSDPSVVIIASKNVPAPGPGAGAYSVAKAGLTQLGRVAALELGEHGIRVNMLHPNAVFDTGIWTDEILKARAKNYGLSVSAYKRNNLLKEEVTSADVAELATAMASGLFRKVTGAQLPIDGGNERVV